MSLATRFSAFFLVALALVLGGFSGTLYLVARTYLHRQLDERLQQALDTLEASVDIEPGGLEWEPGDRRLLLGVDTEVDEVRWSVRDHGERQVDLSANASSGGFPIGWGPAAWPVNPPDGTVFGSTPGWRMAGRHLDLEALLRLGRGQPDDEPGYEVQYPALTLVVGLAPAPLFATLSRLALTVAVLSTAILASAAVVGRWLCRRALAPLNRMAKAARTMTADDLACRLPAPGSGDELDELGRAFNGLLDRLHEAFDRLHEAYDRQRRFAGDASHQLRNPLAALLGQVQVARRRDRAPEEYRRVLDLVHAEGNRLRQIVEALLFIAQPDGAQLEAEVVEVAAWLSNHLQRWNDHPRGADIHTEKADEAPLWIRVHPPLLTQLVDNLLENACKYSEPGTPIVVRACRAEGSVLIEVEDRGFGVSAEDLNRVFEPFFRAERARNLRQGGFGLGLAVAERIATSFGGTLSVRSQSGVGSVFLLRLPEVPLEPASGPQSRNSSAVTAALE